MKHKSIHFRIYDFKLIGRWISRTFPGPISWFLRAWLYGLETKYIDWKAKYEVEQAIKEYEKLCPDFIEDREPTITKKPSEVEGLSDWEIKG